MYRSRRREIEMIKVLKEKKFIDTEMAGYIVDKIVEVMPNLREAVGKYGINMKGMIRFQLVSEMCRNEREKKGLTFKQIAISLKVPQYCLKDVESSSVKNIKVDILENYIDYLDLRRWFNKWKRCNKDVYKHLKEKARK
jgi:hypothetical protein